METRLRHGARELVVALAPAAGGFAATLDGAPHEVVDLATGAAVAAADGATVEELALLIDGRPVRALVARTRDRVLVALAGRVHAFARGADVEGSAARGAGSGLVTAPMPGKVIAVLVAAGDTVDAGQPLVVLEAMKMETTLAAEIAGRVTRVAAAAGAMVGAGEVLVVVEV